MERATRATWASRVREWRASGKPAAEFAATRGINASTLKWWSSELSGPRSTPPVVEVSLGAASEVAELEVRLVGGASIRVPRNFDEETLRRLLGVLEGR
jgi:hypothetical protein